MDQQLPAAIPPVRARRGRGTQSYDWTLWALVGVATALLIAAGGISGLRNYYTPGSAFGYSLGVAGGVMMLALLLYPLRKNLKTLRHLGSAKHWFMFHMALGVAGPIVILFHSTFQAHSLNALVALLSMLLVALSGAVGRFGYSKVHYGLSGRHKNLDELRARARITGGDGASKFSFVPEVEQRLKDFEAYAIHQPMGILGSTWRFLTLGWRIKVIHFACTRELRRFFERYAAKRHWEPQQKERRLRSWRWLARSYLTTVQEVAQFKVYERLFSLWHYLHIPLFFMLIVSGIAHVVAVHMY